MKSTYYRKRGPVSSILFVIFNGTLLALSC